MIYKILNEIPGRMRIGLCGHVPESDIDALHEVICACPGVIDVKIYPRIGSVALCYRTDDGVRETILEHLSAIDAEAVDSARKDFSLSLAPRTSALLMDIAVLTGGFFLRRVCLPASIGALVSFWRYRKFLSAGLHSLGKARLDVSVLDASAIGMSFIKGDPKTAGSTMFLLELGETLEEYTRARSQNELIYSLLSAPESAQLVRSDVETSVPASTLQAGDLIAIRSGMPVCVDGVVESGCAMVNQATLTGEPLAVERGIGDDVFAGSAIEDGEILVRVRANTSETKVRSIVNLVEQSQSCKASVQSRREKLADRIVPWNFLLAGIVALTTRNLEKTSAALMVDYSCALKLTSSISVLSAMSQSVQAGFTVKGSKHFEAFAHADTIVFDKTGTLTEATPKVEDVLAFEGWNRARVLRLAACLEEHFPHPVARAVVREAASRNLKHRERHAEVEYIVAHGIASSLDGKRAVIGSEHFVTEDESVVISADVRALIEKKFDGLSVLYLAVDSVLVGAIGVSDPLKPGARDAVADLCALGFKRIIMLTGDRENNAARIAQEAGIVEYRANMLPEDKHAFIEDLHAQGCRVVMVGDGINDSPALSLADVGVAMAQGTAIAKEVADITLSDGNLSSLVRLRRLSCELMRRLDVSFRQIMAVNSGLLACGIAGVITPQTSSLLHNGTTIALSAHSTKRYDF